MINHRFDFVWLNNWVFTFAHLSTNANIRRLAKKFINDWDKETGLDPILKEILAEASQNPNDKFCQAVLSSFRRTAAFHEEKCDLSKWLSSTNGDHNFNRNLLEIQLAELENERQGVLEAMKRLKT
jgi:hypothetical protein